MCKLLLDQQVTLDIGEDAKRWLGRQGYDPEFGARPLKRVIYQFLLTPLAKRILAGDIKAHGRVRVSVGGDSSGLRLDYQPPEDPNAPPVQPMEPLLETRGRRSVKYRQGQNTAQSGGGIPAARTFDESGWLQPI